MRCVHLLATNFHLPHRSRKANYNTGKRHNMENDKLLVSIIDQIFYVVSAMWDWLMKVANFWFQDCTKGLFTKPQGHYSEFCLPAGGFVFVSPYFLGPTAVFETTSLLPPFLVCHLVSAKYHGAVFGCRKLVEGKSCDGNVLGMIQSQCIRRT